MAHKPRMRREPNGRASRRTDAPMSSPTEVHRIMEQARRDVRLAEFGTILGWMFLSHQITAAQFAAGNRWAKVRRDYAVALQAPRPPRSAGEGRSGRQLDPDSAEGRKEARRHRQVMVEHAMAVSILKLAGEASRQALVNVVERNLVPAGQTERENLGVALSALSGLWSVRRRK